MDPPQAAPAAIGNAVPEPNNLENAAMWAIVLNKIDALSQKVDSNQLPETGREARFDRDFSWTKDGTKKNYNRHVQSAELLEKAQYLLNNNNGQPPTADQANTIAKIIGEGLHLQYKGMLLNKVADSSSYEVAEEYLKTIDHGVYTIDSQKLELAEKAVERRTGKSRAKAGIKKPRFERPYAQNRFPQGSSLGEAIGFVKDVMQLSQHAESSSSKKPNYSTVVCFKCKEPGHIAANCRKSVIG